MSYLPSAFHETRPAVLEAFIRRHSFATLISHGPGGISVSHLPMLLDHSRGAKGRLLGHLARANPQWKELEAGVVEVLVLFNGPHAYISPRWYATPASVPTWNYATVYVRGPARVIHESQRLRELVTTLTREFEGDGPNAWSIEKLPAEYVQKQLGGIVGIEVEITSIDGKFKLNQNRSAADREGVVRELSSHESADDRAIAELMKESLQTT